MDFSDSSKILFRRIQEIDPQNATKVIGFLLLKDHNENEIIRMAFAPDNIIHYIIDKAKNALGLFPQTKNPIVSKLSTNFTPFTPASHSCVPSSSTQNPQFQMDHQPLIHNFNYVNPVVYFDPSIHGFGFQNQHQIFPFDNQFITSDLANNYLYKRPQNLHEQSLKFCEFFSKGYCKHGADCKFLHVLHISDDYIMVLNPPNEKGNNIFSQGSLNQLEVEIIELLKSGGGVPIPIVSLPILYYEKYGRVLKAEGKVDYDLVQMLVQTTNNRINIIQRPHGQNCVILAEDIPRYMRFIKHKDKSEEFFANSCQVYLTFSSQSMFNEHDVYNYFSNFGPVEEVRIPYQPKRMFGFVTFVYPETVTFVLTKGNPHYIRGRQVLVKPYRNKLVLVDRNPEEKVHLPNAEFMSSSSKSVSNGCTSEFQIHQIKTREKNKESSEEVLNLPDSPFTFDYIC